MVYIGSDHIQVHNIGKQVYRSFYHLKTRYFGNPLNTKSGHFPTRFSVAKVQLEGQIYCTLLMGEPVTIHNNIVTIYNK